jgi:hypothetical protein
MEQDLLTLIHRGNSRTSITIRSWSSPYLKTLEMTDIPGAAYKATLSCCDSKYYHAFRLLTIDGIVLVANDRVLVKDQNSIAE